MCQACCQTYFGPDEFYANLKYTDVSFYAQILRFYQENTHISNSRTLPTA